MDGSRFDGIVRALATGTTRRRTLQSLAGGSLAGWLAHVGGEEAAAACVKPGKKGCDGPRNRNCCSGAVCQGGTSTRTGTCKCRGNLKQCGDKCVNTKKDKKHCGGCNKACKGKNTCKNGKCRSKLGCKKGQNICQDPEPLTGLDDPRICDTDGTTFVCLCVTDVEGVARCSDFVNGVCADCSKNSDCPDDFVCIKADGPNCECDENMGSNGNACVRKDCDGVKGSSAPTGRSLLRPPILR